MINKLLLFGAAIVMTGCHCCNHDAKKVDNKVAMSESCNDPRISGADKVEVLSRHFTNAQFKGVQYRLCRGLTTLCPDRCGDSGEFAIFHIDTYRTYDRLGEYADDKQSAFLVQISDYDKKALSDATVKEIALLKEGDVVELDWEQLYITKDNSSYPLRPVKRISKR